MSQKLKTIKAEVIKEIQPQTRVCPRCLKRSAEPDSDLCHECLRVQRQKNGR